MVFNNINDLSVCNNITSNKMGGVSLLLISGGVRTDPNLPSEVNDCPYNNASNFNPNLINMYDTLNNIGFAKVEYVSLLDFYESFIMQQPQWAQNWPTRVVTMFADFVCSAVSTAAPTRLCAFFCFCVYLCACLGLNF